MLGSHVTRKDHAGTFRPSTALQMHHPCPNDVACRFKSKHDIFCQLFGQAIRNRTKPFGQQLSFTFGKENRRLVGIFW